MIPALAIFLAFVLGWAGACLIARFGFRWGLADLPNERSSHVLPVPKGGGIGIPLAAALAAFAFFHTPDVWMFVAALIISLIALINDRSELPVKSRLAASLLLALGAAIIAKSEVLVWTDPLVAARSGLILLVLAVYIAASSNFFNFMDGINGIAGFEAIVSFTALGVFAFERTRESGQLWIAISIAAAAAGFLLLNFPRARVFMGDVGSLFLGFLFASLSVSLATDLKDFLCLSSFQSLFLIDCVSTIGLRLLKKENIMRAHRQHFYQKLVHLWGWPHARVTLIYAGSQAFVAALALALRNSRLGIFILLWAAQIAAYWALQAAGRFINVRPARLSPK